MRAPTFRNSPPSMRALPRGRFVVTKTALTLGIIVLAMSSPARQAGASDPTAPIQRLDMALLAAMKADQTMSFMQRCTMLGPAVAQTFDLSALLRGAVGLRWDGLPPDQKAALADAFERYTVSNYAANFDSYDGQNFQVLPQARALQNGEVVVRTQIIRPGKSPVEIDYVVRQAGEDWKVVDVLTNGTISQVAVQRSDFGGLLATGGATALRVALERKVVTLSDGRPAS